MEWAGKTKGSARMARQLCGTTKDKAENPATGFKGTKSQPTESVGSWRWLQDFVDQQVLWIERLEFNVTKYPVVQCSAASCGISFLLIGAKMAGRLIDGEPYCTECYKVWTERKAKEDRDRPCS